LAAAGAQHVPTDQALNALRYKQSALRTAGDAAGTQATGASIKGVVAKAGQAYADHVTARNALATRLHRIRTNVVGRENQGEELKAAQPAAIAKPAVERISAAAVRVGGREYTGINHADAYDALVKAEGKEPDFYEDGFVTDRGRFVEREEATKIAERAQQITR